MKKAELTEKTAERTDTLRGFWWVLFADERVVRAVDRGIDPVGSGTVVASICATLMV